MLKIVASPIDNARVIIYVLAFAWIINYDSRIVIYCFIVLATVFMIVNYDCKTYIVQATVMGKEKTNHKLFHHFMMN